MLASTSSLPSVFTFYTRKSIRCFTVRNDRWIQTLKSLSASELDSQSVRAIQCRVFKSGSLDVALAADLIGALGRTGDLRSACRLFNEMSEKDVPLWNSLLSVYTRNGSPQKAYALVKSMFLTEARPNSVTLSILLQFKSTGRCVHSYLWRNPWVGDTFLYNSLLVYYRTLGRIEIVERLFEEMPTRDIVSWNVMISAYAMNNRHDQVLEMFRHLKKEGIKPDIVTLETILGSCGYLGEDGKCIHALVILMGLVTDVYVENSLLLMYSRSGSLQYAHHLFDKMEMKNIVSWNILMKGYVENSLPHNALSFFKYAHSVLSSKMSSDLMVGAFVAMKELSPCLQLIMSCHGLAMVLGFMMDNFVISSLMSAYGENMDATLVRGCFEHVFARDTSIVLWNAMLSVSLRHGYLLEALEMMRVMLNHHTMPDAVTVVSALSISCQMGNGKLGRVLHGYAIRNALEENSFVCSSLLDSYIECLSIGNAWQMFMRASSKVTASWNIMIFGCARNGHPDASAWLFHMMPKKDASALVGVIEAISQRGYQGEADYIHGYAIEEGYFDNEFVVNSLISLHGKLGNIDKASEVFNGRIRDDKATWNVMMAECLNNDLPHIVLSLLHLMKDNRLIPDEISLLSLLPACANMASLQCTMWAHANTLKLGWDEDVFVATALGDAYAKCGELKMGRRVFDNIKHRTTATWNCMIRAHGMSGDMDESSKLFNEMIASGIKPNHVTFLVLISSCSHLGDVERGLGYHDLMTEVYSLTPKMEHYSCVVDLLARRGLIEESMEFLEKIPALPDKISWGSILAACREKGNIHVAMALSGRLFEMDPFNNGYNMLLSGILSESNRWEDAYEVRKKLGIMRQRNPQGLSIIEV